MTRREAILSWLEEFAPLARAASWDNVGLLLGERDGPVEGVLTCLTITPPVVAEALAKNVQLIVTHHPVLFKPTQKLTTDSAEGQLLWPLLRAGIAVYSPHTAFDNCPGGINDQLAAQIGLQQVRALRRAETKLLKLAVFVPEADMVRVQAALFAAGAGQIGVYSGCSFRTLGTGTFFPEAGANPTIGRVGHPEEVAEYRLETILPAEKKTAVVAALRQAHSYEEPAYDLYPLVGAPTHQGEGRYGTLPEAIPLRAIAERLRTSTRAVAMQMIGETDRPIRTVAVACGAAGEFLGDALKAQADLFITGELRFHELLRAEAGNLAVLMPGHFATERPALEWLADRLTQVFPGLVAFASAAETDPLKFVDFEDAT
ncbi:MAG: Nif3-like dinuclear metal center hexameric protein [Gemmataceae bacterium]